MPIFFIRKKEIILISIDKSVSRLLLGVKCAFVQDVITERPSLVILICSVRASGDPETSSLWLAGLCCVGNRPRRGLAGVEKPL